MREGLVAALPHALLPCAQFLLQQRCLDAAIEMLDHAESAGCCLETCAAARWTAYMLQGNFAAAWRESERIRRRSTPDPHRFWLGERLFNKRVIVRCLHGFGDTVQLLRYVPLLCESSLQVVIELPPAMMDLAACFAGFDRVERVLTWADRDGRNTDRGPYAWDVQCEVMELPYMFRTEVSDLPLAIRYFQAPEAIRRRAREVMGRSCALRVGMVWAAGEWNVGRSIALKRLAPVLDVAGCEFWSLQGGDARWEWSMLACPALRDAAECGEGMLRLAAVIAEMDLVITVDTLAAHLAGAQGIPVWVLLQHAADWRWLTERDDSPWYPSARLFRQPLAGDWESVVGTVVRALQDLPAVRDAGRLGCG